MKIKKRKDPHRWSAILTIAKKKPAKIQALTGFKPVPSMYNNQLVSGMKRVQFHYCMNCLKLLFCNC